MKTEIDPKTTERAQSFEIWKNAPMPKVTLVKTFDVGRVVRLSRRKGLKLNMLICWCIARAAKDLKEFYMLPMGERYLKYDRLAVNVVVPVKNGGVTLCDIPFMDDLKQFNDDYLRLTQTAHETGEPHNLSDDYMVISTSALPDCEIDTVVSIYAEVFNTPFLAWGKYRHKLFKTVLPISFQFHHAQMDGLEAAHFLNDLQAEFKKLSI